MASPGAKSDKTAVDIQFHKGINGSVAINNLPEGFCIESTNTDMSTLGIVKKRNGYQMTHKLPIKVLGVGSNSYRLDSTPLTTFGMQVWTYEDSVRFNINNAFDLRYYVSELASPTNVICKATTPEPISMDTLIELADGSFTSPTHIFDSAQGIFTIPASCITTAKVGFTYTDLDTAQTLTVTAPNLPIFHIGASFPRIGEADVSSMFLQSGTELVMQLPADHEFAVVGSSLFIENSIYAASKTPMTGTVTTVSGLQVVITLDATADAIVGTAIEVSYLSIRYFLKKTTFVYRQPYATSESGTGRHYLLGVNTIKNSGYTSNTLAGQVFLYGTELGPGKVHSLNSLYHALEGKTRLVSMVNGHMFKEADYPSYGLKTVRGLKATTTGAYLIVRKDTLGRYTLPVNSASTVYKVGDIAIIQTVIDSIGNYTTAEYEILTVNTNNIIVRADADSMTIYNHTRINFKRTSTSVPYIYTVNPTLLVHGSVVYINDVAHVVEDVDTVNKILTFRVAFEFESELDITLDTYMQPIYISSTFDSSNPKLDENPITSSYFEGEIEPYTTQFDNALFFACGNNGIVRYDGSNAYYFNLPQPPSGHLRSIPESIGFLPVTSGENNVVVAKQVQLFVTYSFEDGLGRKVESGVTPDTDMMIIPEALQDESGYSRVVELQIPSIHRESGLPADKIKINVYRFMQTEDEGESFAPVLDVSVANDPDKPFTICRVGTQYVMEFSSRDKLYTYDETKAGDVYRESVIKAPYAKFVTAFNNRVVAANGATPPYFEIAGSSVYNINNANRFGAFCKLAYQPFGVGATDVNSYEFYNIPMGLIANALTWDTGDFPAYYPTAAQVHADKISFPSNATQAISTLVFDEASHKFSVTCDATVDYTASTGVGNLFKLRTVSPTAISTLLPINLNKDVFTQHTAYVFGTNKLYLASNSKWTLPNITAGVPTELANSKLVVFKSGFGAITTVGATGDAFVTASESVYKLYIKASHGSYVLNQFNGKYLILHGLGTIGNLHLSTNTKQLSFDSELIFLAGAEGTDANFTGYGVYTLVPKNLKESQTSAGKPVFEDVSILASVGGIVATDTSYKLSIFVMMQSASDAMGLPSGFSAPATTLKVNIADATNFAVGQFVAFDLPQSLVLPDGWPKLARSNKITAKNVNELTVQITPSDKVLSATVPQTITPGASAYLYNQSTAMAIGTDITINMTNTPSGVVADDYVYVCYRDVDDMSVALSLSGWFRVVSVDGINKKIVVSIGNTALIDLTSVPTPRWGFVMWIERGSATTRKIPIPVPYQLDTIDIAGAHFDQNAAVRITPLSAIMKRMVCGINSVLNKYGFAYWGGATGSITYPSNGFRFVAHKNPTDRYRHYKKSGNNYVYVRTTASSLDNSFDTFSITSATGYYVINANIYSNNSYSPQTIPATANTFTYRNDIYSSRIWFTSAVSPNVIRAARISSFHNGDYVDVNSADGEEITGLCVFQDALLVFKNNSIFRLRFADNQTDLQRIQSPVGSIAGKTIVAYEEGVYFIHNSGIFITDGVTTSAVFETGRYFDERIRQNQPLLPYGAGYMDPKKKEVRLGIPYSKDGSVVDSVSNQIVYNWNAKAWSINTDLPAIWWTSITNKNYFCTSDGKIWKIREDTDANRYRDDQSAIALEVVTRYIDESTASAFKFYRNLILQFGNSTDNNFTVGLGWNYATAYATIGVVPITSYVYGNGPYAAVSTPYGCNRFLTSVRQSASPNRAAQLSVSLQESTVDADGAIYGIKVEAQLLTTTNIRQVNQR